MHRRRARRPGTVTTAITAEVYEMSQNAHKPQAEEYPDCALEFTFNPRDPTLKDEFDPDEVVIFEPMGEHLGSRWISGKRDSYVSIDEMR